MNENSDGVNEEFFYICKTCVYILLNSQQNN